MSDTAFLPEQPPLMSAVKARNLARSYKAFRGQHFDEQNLQL